MRITSGIYRGRALKSPSGGQDYRSSRGNRHRSDFSYPTGDTSHRCGSRPVTHPMGDREKLALFNAIVSVSLDDRSATNRPPSSNPQLPSSQASNSRLSNPQPHHSRGLPLAGAKVLDCFAGSGALGLEALSRGASSVVFIEKSRRAVDTIRANIHSLGADATARTTVISGDIHAIISPLDIGANTRIKTSRHFFLEDQFDLILVDPPYDKFDAVFSKNLATRLASLLAESGLLALSHPAASPNIDGLTPVFSKRYAAAHITIYQK